MCFCPRPLPRLQSCLAKAPRHNGVGSRGARGLRGPLMLGGPTNVTASLCEWYQEAGYFRDSPSVLGSDCSFLPRWHLPLSRLAKPVPNLTARTGPAQTGRVGVSGQGKA